MSGASPRLLTALPLALAAVILAAAPALGRIRNLLLDTLGERFLVALAVATATAGAAAFVWAVVRIRERRAKRYTYLAVAFALVAVQVVWWQSGDARVDVVERIHLLEYGSLAFAFFLALRGTIRGWALPALALVATTLVGVADEAVQWWTPLRVGDGRDVLLNLLAGLVGVAFALALVPPTTDGAPGHRPDRRPDRRSLRWLGVGLAVLVLAGAAFVHAAHLGHWVRDEVDGGAVAFRSRWTAEELVEIRDVRAREYAADPPTELSAYGAEDFFLTEAARHVQARNEAVAAGDWVAAWGENRILEEWYEPFLGLRSFSSGDLHRWPDEQRRDVASRRHGAAMGYVSPVFEGHLATGVPAWWLWGGAGVVAAALVMGFGGRRPRS